MNISSLVRVISPTFICKRNLNCWTTGITKMHRKVYLRLYPTIMVLPDGSSINVDYHEPRQIIILPADINTVSEAERAERIENRKTKRKVVIEEDIEVEFDEKRYLNVVK